MNNNLLKLQQKLIDELDRLDNENENIELEVSRSNALSTIATTFIKSINAQLRVKEISEKYEMTQSKLNQELGIEYEK